MEITAIKIAPFWMLMYWLFLTSGRWYHGWANDFVEREMCDLKKKFVYDFFVQF